MSLVTSHNRNEKPAGEVKKTEQKFIFFPIKHQDRHQQNLLFIVVSNIRHI